MTRAGRTSYLLAAVAWRHCPLSSWTLQRHHHRQTQVCIVLVDGTSPSLMMCCHIAATTCSDANSNLMVFMARECVVGRSWPDVIIRKWLSLEGTRLERASPPSEPRWQFRAGAPREALQR
mmetsp:Transcript_16703/g.28877  ORF Transcript_16703/g.28877 Transcript_16703/m.28877 type:complete len:121 (-) Transcript_16703:25-387(-)